MPNLLLKRSDEVRLCPSFSVLIPPPDSQPVSRRAPICPLLKRLPPETTYQALYFKVICALEVLCCRKLDIEELVFSMDRFALFSECRIKFASKNAADVQAAISLLDSHDLKDDPSVSTLSPYSLILLLSHPALPSHRLQHTFHLCLLKADSLSTRLYRHVQELI